MSNISETIRGRPLSGYVHMERSDGATSSFSNHIMLSHYKIILRSLLGKNNGSIGVFGAGTDSTQASAKNLNQMTSETDSNEISSYTDVLGADPVDSLSELEVDIDFDNVPEFVMDNTSAIHFSGAFGATTNDELDDNDIAEIALFSRDNNAADGRGDMFARTIIPEDERLEKFPGATITFFWVIYYGFEEETFFNMNGLSP